MKKIKVEIDSEDLIPFAIQMGVDQMIDRIYELLTSKEFIKYLEDKTSTALKEIANAEVQGIKDVQLDGIGAEKSLYLNSMKTEIKDNQIILYNDATIDLTQKPLKPSTLARYNPPTLSLAKIIEYGIGYTGGSNAIYSPEDWEYDVRNHGFRGWYYKDTNGVVHWTNGLEGRYVFLKLIFWIENNAKRLIYEYLQNNM